MQLASLGSGSRGNSILVRTGRTMLMVDCGFSHREAVARLGQMDLRPGDLSAILITHEHSDHLGGGALGLAGRHGVPLHLSRGTRLAAGAAVREGLGRLEADGGLQYLRDGDALQIGDIIARPVTVPHDAREPLQFVFESGGTKLGILSDLGCTPHHLQRAYEGCHLMMLEANYDPQMLRDGDYPPHTKERIAGDFGHLSNRQSRDFVDRIDNGALRTLLIGHISQNNNSPELVAACFADLGERLSLHYARQDMPCQWLAAA